MANHTISDFVGGFNGGLRTNRFLVNCDRGGFGDMPYHARAASFPPVTTSVLQVPHRGRVYKMPGQRTFAPWSMTVLDDTGTNALYAKFYSWANAIQNNISNTTSSGTTDFSSFFATFTVTQLDFNGNNIKSVQLIGAWPSEVGEIRFSSDDAESLCSFNVQLEYQYLSP